MNYDQLSFLNPNYFHGCHPLDLCSYFESDPFFEKLDSAFPIKLPNADANPAAPTFRQQVLKRLLENISTQNLVGRCYVEQYLRDQYRRNCRPNTLRLAATSLTLFLSFLHQLGKTHAVGRVVYYSEDAQQALLAWFKIRDSSKERLFYGQGKGSQSLCYGAARMMFIKYLHKAGLQYSGYTLHCLRLSSGLYGASVLSSILW